MSDRKRRLDVDGSSGHYKKSMKDEEMRKQVLQSRLASYYSYEEYKNMPKKH